MISRLKCNNIMRDKIVNKYFDFLADKNISFEELAIDIFNYQKSSNQVYNSFLRHFGKIDVVIDDIKDIPFMPVSFFRSNSIKSGEWDEVSIFESSTTSGASPSRHFVRDFEIYHKTALYCFESAFGNIKEYNFLALLPSYLERGGSSLVSMVNDFIDSGNGGKFYKYDYNALLDDLKSRDKSKKIILIGVTFALLEFASQNSIDLSDVIIMETGGMKGRGKELPREEVHKILMDSFGVKSVYSEYGMTELFSQSYSKGEGIFDLAPTMKVVISDVFDPIDKMPTGEQGKINIIDLANIDTCSFLSTDDLGIYLGNSKFKVLGRTDESDVRGCNLMFE